MQITAAANKIEVFEENAMLSVWIALLVLLARNADCGGQWYKQHPCLQQ